NDLLRHLAVDRNVAASYQNQALAAILFLYMKFLGTELKLDSVRAKPSHKLPVVLSALEVTTVLRLIPASPQHTIVSLLYGAGLRSKAPAASASKTSTSLANKSLPAKGKEAPVS
ncbi:MAG: phage integrase N-terminal SAM-like domain-containing protein, partial [Pirellulaceae bacterium]